MSQKLYRNPYEMHNEFEVYHRLYDIMHELDDASLLGPKSNIPIHLKSTNVKMIFIKKFPQEECVEEGRVGHGSMHKYPSHPSKRFEKYKWENSSFCDSSDPLK